MKQRCPGCRYFLTGSFLLCEFCSNRIEPDERQALHDFIRDYWLSDRNHILKRWLGAIVQAVQLDRRAGRRLGLCEHGQKNRVFPRVS